LEAESFFRSDYRNYREEIRHTRHNWVCYDFKERRILPTHYTIRTNWQDPSRPRLKSWLVGTSADGESWREVDGKDDNGNVKGRRFTGTFAVADGAECRFIWLVSIGRNHCGNGLIAFSAWEIFGGLAK
jgi:hypothetical protein